MTQALSDLQALYKLLVLQGRHALAGIGISGAKRLGNKVQEMGHGTRFCLLAAFSVSEFSRVPGSRPQRDTSMPSKRARERRRWARLLFAIPTFVRGRDTQGKEFLEFATILNVSAGGVLLVTRKQMHPRSHISLEIPVGPPLAESLETQRKFQARVLRNIPMNGFYSYAAQFKSPLRS